MFIKLVMSLQDDENDSNEEPTKFPAKNPFEEGLLERLSAPLISSPFFQSIVRTRMKSCDGSFSWSIEDRARLFPANIDESQHINTPPYSSDKEQSIQLVIHRYFHENSIVPSPLLNSSDLKCAADGESTSKSTQSSTHSETELNGSFTSARDIEKCKAPDMHIESTPKIPEDNNVWTQTFLSLTRASVDDIVGSVEKCLPDQQDGECLSGRIFPRKLSFSRGPSPTYLESTRISPSHSKFSFSVAAPELIINSECGQQQDEFLNSMSDNAMDTPCSSTPDSKSGRVANPDFSFSSTPEVYSSKAAWTQTYLTLPPNCNGDMTESIKACETRLQDERIKRIEDCSSKRIQRKLRFSTEKSPHLFFKGRYDHIEMTPSPLTRSSKTPNSGIIQRLGCSPALFIDSPALSPITKDEKRVRSTRRCLTTQLLSPEGVLKEEAESDNEDSSIPDPSRHPSTFMEATCNDERLERLLEEDIRSLSPASSVDEMITSQNNSVSVMDGDTGYDTGLKSRLSESGLTQGMDTMFMQKVSRCSDYDMQSSRTIDYQQFTPPESSTPNLKKHLMNAYGKQNTCNDDHC